MKYIVVPDTQDETTVIPIDNIAYVTEYEGTTRIYLRQVAMTGPGSLAWYILTHLPVGEVMRRVQAE